MPHDPALPGHAVRVLEPDGLRAAHDLFAAALLRERIGDDAWTARVAAGFSPGRTLGVHEGDALVATATSFPATTAVPGGARLPLAAVTRVGVRADRTRRGLLSALMAAQLADVAARGEPLASLHATEAGIYGRFGYGVATRSRSVRVRPGGWRPQAPAGGDVRLLDPAETVDVLAPLHARLTLLRPGGLTRPEHWWAFLRSRLSEREPVLAAVHTGPDGDDGFAVATARPTGAHPTGDGFVRELRVDDLHAADAAATGALWRFLLGIDLAGAVEATLRPVDEPLELLLADPRAVTVTGVADETWLRLVDVPAALAARSWGAAGPVLLAVHDPLLPANAGVYRIGDGAAERVGPLGSGPAPDLTCDVAALAMAYLGDRRPSELVATGWWTATDPAVDPTADPTAAARADALFATVRPPWCGTMF